MKQQNQEVLPAEKKNLISQKGSGLQQTQPVVDGLESD